MRDPTRIKSICRLLEQAWSYFPDERLGQFLLNIVFGSRGRDSHIYHKEDDEIETFLKAFIQKLDEFKGLPKTEEREKRKLFIKKIVRENQKLIKKQEKNEKYI